MCDCAPDLILDDDEHDGEWCCEEAEAEFNYATGAFQPADEPQPEPLVPQNDELPIEINTPNAHNVAGLVKAFSIGYNHLSTRAVVTAPMTEADIMAAITQIWRGFTVQTVTMRAAINPSAAVANKTLILHKLETLIDEILTKADPGTPTVN
jgi:hypothetical protein